MTISDEELLRLRDDYYGSRDKVKNVAEPYNPGLISSYNQSLQGKQPTGLVYQNTQSKNPTLADNIANTVMKPVAKGVEMAQSNPFVSWFVNPLINLSQLVGQYLIDPAMRVVSTPLLVSDALEQGKSLDYAWEQAQYISPGQAFMNATFLPADNIFDEKSRKELYEDTWLGLLTSGSIDLGVNILGSKGTGAAVRGGKNLVLGSNQIKSAAQIRPFVDEAVAWAEAGAVGKAPNSWATFIDEAVNTNDIVALRTNPFVQNSKYPDRLATLLAGTNTHRGVAEILMAERGDIMALNRLRDELPLAHDALTDFGQDLTKPLTDWSQVHKLPDGPEVDQYKKIINAIAEKDENFARSLNQFVDDVANDKFYTGWQPGKFAALEKFKLFPKKFKLATLYGDWSYLKSSSQTGWVVKSRQGDRYTRGIRLFQYVNGTKARGYINVANPRMDESVTEIISEINRIGFLKDNLTFKNNAISKYTRAATNDDRAMALYEIERDALIEMAVYYNVGNIREIALAGGDISVQRKFLGELYDSLNSRRQSTMDFVQQHGFEVDADGNINLFKGPGLRSQNNLTSTEAQNIPMMDLGRLEAVLVNNLKRLEGTRGAVGSFDLKRKDVTRSSLKAGPIGEALMTVGMFGDRLHMLFSNTHLLRPAFVPKNSFIDNNMRASMSLERVMGLSGGTPLEVAKNMANNTRRRATSIVPKTFRNKLGRDARLLQKERDEAAILLGGVEKNLMKINSQIRKSEDKLASLNEQLKTAKGKSPDVVDLRQAIQKEIADEERRLKDFKLDLDAENIAFQNVSDGLRETSTKIAYLISELQDEKAAIKSIKNNAIVIKTADGPIEIKGVFDPNTKGGSYYETANGSMDAWYEATTMAQSRLRLKNEVSDVELIYNPSNPAMTADYFEALSAQINRQIRNNEVGDMMLRGATDDEIFKWLRESADGREYLNRMALRIDSDSGGLWLPDEKIYSWLQTTRSNIEAQIPSAELREIATRRPVLPKEVRAYLEPYGNSLPTIIGPNTRSAYKSMTFMEKGLGLAETVGPELGWKGISWFENKFARTPLFQAYFKEEMEQMVKLMEANGRKVTYELLDGPMRQQAMRQALTRVDDTLYASRRLTNGMYAMRYVMAFPAAYFNSQKVGLKLLAKNPWNAYWYNSVAQSMDSLGVFGAYYEDTETGTIYEKLADVPDGVNVSVRFNLPEPVKQKLKDFGMDAYLDSALGGVAIPQKQLEFMLQDPSLSFTATAALSEVVKMADGDSPIFGNITGMQIIDAMKNTFGEDFYNNSIFFQGRIVDGANILETLYNNIMPTSYKQLWGAAFGNQNDEMLVDEANRLYRVQMRDWINNGSNPANKPNYEETVKAAKNVLLTRFLTWMNAPLSVSFDPASREAMMRYSQLMDKHKNAGGEQYALATDEFVKLYGIGSLALLGSSNYRVLGQTSTVNGQDILYNHGDLIQQIIKDTGSPDSAEILFWSPDGDAGDYQPDIAALQKRMTVPGTGGEKIVRPKTAQEVRDDIEKRIGWYEYTKLDQLRQAEMEQWGVPSTSSTLYTRLGIRDRFANAERLLREKYPAWDRSRVFNTQNWYTVVGDALNTALSDPKWMARSDKQLWWEIGRYMNVANAFRDAYESSTSSTQMEIYRKNFEESYYGMLNSFSTQFGAFASRWLSNHPLINRDFTEEVLGG